MLLAGFASTEDLCLAQDHLGLECNTCTIMPLRAASSGDVLQSQKSHAKDLAEFQMLPLHNQARRCFENSAKFTF